MYFLAVLAHTETVLPGEYPLDYYLKKGGPKQVYFRGELKQEKGEFVYDGDFPPGPHPCGIYQDGEHVYLTDAMHPNSFLFKLTWSELIARVRASSPNEVFLESTGKVFPYSHYLVTGDELKTVHIEFWSPEPVRSPQAFQKNSFVIGFYKDKPVSYERRWFPADHYTSDRFKFFARKDLAPVQANDRGERYFMEYRCEANAIF